MNPIIENILSKLKPISYDDLEDLSGTDNGKNIISNFLAGIQTIGLGDDRYRYNITMCTKCGILNMKVYHAEI